MAASVVVATANSTSNGNNVTLSLGSDLAENDVVILVGGFAGGTSTAPGALGPTGFASIITAVDSAEADWTAQWLRAGATPPTSILAAGSGNGTDAVSYGTIVARGIKTDGNPWQDVKTSIAGVGVGQSPSIITTTDGALVVAGVSVDVHDNSRGVVTNFSHSQSASNNDTDDLGTGIAASIISTAGSIAPNAWSAWNSGTYFGITVALEATSVVGGATAIKDIIGTGIIPFSR